ncbi:MAG: S8 family serine peptidase, partial [Candidatus Hodarchaeota archaeon]
MRLSKSKKGYVTSTIFILVIIFPYNLPQLNKTHEEEIVLTSNTPNSGINIINHNFLFTYNPAEKIKLTEVFNRFNAIKINYYRNFPIGFVTLNSQNFLKIKNSYPEIFSRLHVSKSNLALPSIEELRVASKLSQFDYIPPSSIINATILWDKGIDGSGIKIGIIDSGIDTSRPDFEERIDFSESFVTSTYGYDSEEGPEDLHGHGTHVAGIAAGSGVLKGIAPKARIYNLKAVSMGGHSTKESVIAAIDKAISLNLDILSISLGFGSSLPWDSEDEMSLAINAAVNNGITVVVAAGNEGEDNPLSTIGTPASASKAITVGATNGSRHVVAFSSRGPSIDYRFDPDVVAPGYQIAGPLASGGVIDLAYNAIEGITPGDYVWLSGTSMATPVVSGAIALLKQQFKNASPYVLRAALQKTAVDLGSKESIYSQGSGLINVASAMDLLSTTHKSSGFQLISSLPRANNARPVEFSERITYPGDSTQATFSVVTGMEGTIDWTVSNSIKKFINIDNLTDNFSESTLIEKFIEVDIPLNTIPGRYKGNISYNFNDKLYSIPVDINVKVPHAKIYWDTWRTGRDDSTFFNYRALDEILDSKLSFDIDSYTKTITWENISQNDILVLTDLENPLSHIEIEQIKRFHDHNGSILLVASAQPYFNPQAYSQIIEKLNLPINFSRRIDLISYLDDGRNRNIVPLTADELQLNWDSKDELFVGVEQVPPFIGTGFSVNRSDPRLKHVANVFSNYAVVAAIEPLNKGKFLFLGSENWLYSSFLSTSSGENFVQNIFNWLEPTVDFSINSRISPRTRKLELSAYYSSQDPLAIDISFPNGTILSSTSLTFNSTLGYYYQIIYLGDIGNQEIIITVRDSGLVLKKFNQVILEVSTIPKILDLQINTITSQNPIIPSWSQDVESVNLVDQGLNI